MYKNVLQHSRLYIIKRVRLSDNWWFTLTHLDKTTFLAMFFKSILQAALFSISLLNSDNPQAGGISQSTEPDMGAVQTF